MWLQSKSMGGHQVILTVTVNPAVDKVYQVNSFAVGGVFRPNKMWVTAGGKGINVSRVASILGEEVTATGFLGGNNGQFIREQLGKQGIKDAFIKIAEETRTCIAINDPTSDTSTEVLELGPTIASQEQTDFLEHFRSAAGNTDIITMSGSLPNGIPMDFYGKLIKISKEYGKRVLLDTSGKALVEGIKYSPFMIKPNKSELEAVIGRRLTEEDILKAACDIHQKGIELVCVTLGADGCIAVTAQGAFCLRASAIKTVNTVGSGDAFVAGCAVALSQNRSIEDILKTGMACGMANTQFAETGKVSCELVDRFFRMVSIEKISI